MDDKLTIAVSSSHPSLANLYPQPPSLIAILNAAYDPSLTIEPEARWLKSAWHYIGSLVYVSSLRPIQYSSVPFLKNSFFHALRPDSILPSLCADPSVQLFRSELHYRSYQPKSQLVGQRVARYIDIIRCTPPDLLLTLLQYKTAEHHKHLGDPLSFVISNYTKAARFRLDLPSPKDVLSPLYKR
jgi:hypothetical protein